MFKFLRGSEHLSVLIFQRQGRLSGLILTKAIVTDCLLIIQVEHEVIKNILMRYDMLNNTVYGFPKRLIVTSDIFDNNISYYKTFIHIMLISWDVFEKTTTSLAYLY